MTLKQFVRKFQRTAKRRKWAVNKWGRLRTVDDDEYCPIEFLQGRPDIYHNALLSERDTIRVVDASDDTYLDNDTALDRLRIQLLRAARVKE